MHLAALNIAPVWVRTNIVATRAAGARREHSPRDHQEEEPGQQLPQDQARAMVQQARVGRNPTLQRKQVLNYDLKKGFDYDKQAMES